jgi:long-chain acyl-CoA synthetase
VKSYAPTIRLIQDILEKNVTEHPNKIGLICENQRLTYLQIDDMSNRLANAFIKNGVEKGDRILFYLLNCAELVVSIFAALKANAIFSVIDYANTFDTLRYMASDCDAAALVTHTHQVESAVRLMSEIPSLKVSVLTGKDTEYQSPNILGYDAIQNDYPSDPPPGQIIGCDLAYLLYTSGSTGQAKGVMTTHQNSLFTAESGIEQFGLSEDDIHASPLPLSFAPGMNQFLQTFRVAGTLIMEKSFAYPVMTLKRMESEGATGFGCVPTILTLLLQTGISRFNLSRLRYLISSGAALEPGIILKIRKALPETSVFSMYGMAEASYSLCLEPRKIDRYLTSVGKPFPGTQAWIVDEEGRRLGSDKVGELVVRGGHVRSGYWNNTTASAQRFRPGPLPGEQVCFTGDMFRMDDEGYFYFVSRSDEIIKSGAKKVAPKEIENVLYELEGVLEAAVIGIPDPVLGKVIKAFIVLNEQSQNSLTVEDILKQCYQSLEAYKVPQQIEIRKSLPKTSGGKIKKTDLV